MISTGGRAWGPLCRSAGHQWEQVKAGDTGVRDQGSWGLESTAGRNFLSSPAEGGVLDARADRVLALT